MFCLIFGTTDTSDTFIHYLLRMLFNQHSCFKWRDIFFGSGLLATLFITTDFCHFKRSVFRMFFMAVNSLHSFTDLMLFYPTVLPELVYFTVTNHNHTKNQNNKITTPKLHNKQILKRKRNSLLVIKTRPKLFALDTDSFEL